MVLKPFPERNEREQVAALRSLVAAKFESEGQPLATCRKIAHQHKTTFCAVSRRGEHWFVRLSRTSDRTPEQVQAETTWVQELAGAGFPVTSPEPWARGEVVCNLEASWLSEPRLAVRFGWSRGVVARRPSEAQWHAIGAIMAQLHNHTANRTDLGQGRWNVDELVGNSGTEEEALEDARLCLGDVAAETLSRVKDAYRMLRPNLGPVQLLHGDLHELNVLWQGMQPTVVDFDDCGWAPPLYDLAVPISEFRDRGNVAQEAALVDGYASVRPLPPGLGDRGPAERPSGS
jgi:Ser/Thr protein kinase RdoA (MazF antagonist)